jgi:hypothetical protein
MDVGKTKFLKPLVHYSRLKISGVSISVSVDLRTEKVDSKGLKSVGGVMLVFSKSGGPDNNLPDRCKAITLLIQELLKGYVKGNKKLDPTPCIAIDVFNGKIYRAKSQQDSSTKPSRTHAVKLRLCGLVSSHRRTTTDRRSPKIDLWLNSLAKCSRALVRPSALH